MQELEDMYLFKQTILLLPFYLKREHCHNFSSSDSNCKSKCYEQTNAIIIVTFTRHTINLVVHVEYIKYTLKDGEV